MKQLAVNMDGPGQLRLAAIHALHKELIHSGSAAKVDAKNNYWLVCPRRGAQTVEIWQIVPIVSIWFALSYPSLTLLRGISEQPLSLSC